MLRQEKKKPRKARTKTGCRTCRIRRVKCDEARPACEKCTSTGRICDGYELPPPAVVYAARQNQHRRPLMPYQGVANVQPHLSSLESQFFSFFQRHTTREVSGYFQSSLWDRYILQLTHHEPAILHAAVAVGAMHRVSRGNSPTLQALNSYREQLDRQQSFALAQYVKALRCLREMLDKQRHDDNNKTIIVVTLVACLLFICLEMLQGNRVGSLQHLKTGLRVLTESHNTTPKTGAERLFVNSGQLNPTILDSLTSVFGRLDYEATMFDKTAPLLQLRPPEGGDEIPSKFSSVAHAREYLDQMAADVFRFRAELLQRASSSSSLDVSEDRDWVREYVIQNIASRRIVHCEEETVLLAELFRLQNNLTLWLAAFRSITLSNSSVQETSLRRSLQLLEIQHFYLFFIAHTYSDRTETACDRFMPLFKHIIELAESFMSCDNTRSSTSSSGEDDGTSTITFTLESGISPSLFLISLKCRDSNLRRHALRLLSENSCQEGMWEGALLAKFMSEVIDMEESYVIQNEGYSRNKIIKAEDIPEHARLSDVAVMGCNDIAGRGRVVGGVYVDTAGIVLRERVFVI